MYKTTLLVVNVIFEGHARIIIEKSCKSCDLQDSVRRERDSNPRYLAVRRFSRPVYSTTLPSLQAITQLSFCNRLLVEKRVQS